MNHGGDAAEQVVRLSLEGFEVIARLTGTAAKHTALMLMATLKQEEKTKGKHSITKMIKSGKELSVFSIQNKDLKSFCNEAKRYGVLYCVLKDKKDKSKTATIDIIARREDLPKIQRIVDRFGLAKVDKAEIVGNGSNPSIAKTDKNHLSRQDCYTPDIMEDKKTSVIEKIKSLKQKYVQHSITKKDKTKSKER